MSQIVPGGVSPMMAAMGGDPLDELGVIDRSLRFRLTASAYLARLFSAPTNANVWTWSGWVRRTVLGGAGTLMATSVGGFQHGFGFNTGDTFFIQRGSAATDQSSAVYRDVGDHVHVTVVSNGTTTVAHINGVQVLSAAGLIANINTAQNISIGRNPNGPNSYLEGYVSHVAFVDGQALPPTTFAQSHSVTKQWRPKSKAAIRAGVAVGGGVRNGWGVNGFFLHFDDPTTLTSLCYDRSQSDSDTTGNNFTANNISLSAGRSYDSSLDTPTNKFPTLNSLNPLMASGVAMEDGNLRASIVGGTFFKAATMPIVGKAYVEVTVNTGSNNVIGIVLPSKTAGYPGASAADYGLYQGDGKLYNNSVAGATLAGTYSAGDVFMMAMDAATGKLWFGRNGAWLGSGDPATGANPAVTAAISADWLFALGASGSADQSINFGQRPFSYSLPAGFKSLCAKNLTRPPIPNATQGHVSKVDTGANIVATMAAATAGWGKSIMAYHRIGTAEDWRWVFSDDATNYLRTPTIAAKAAFAGSLNAAASYECMAFNCDPRFGMNTGTFVHVNGVADTINDGLANSRKMVVLTSEAGSSWWVYHPDLTAGKLLYLHGNAVETTDASISTVLSGSFVAAAALPSGTYRWMCFSEIAGFLRLFKASGNSSVDGTFIGSDMEVATCISRRNDAGSTANWIVHNAGRNPGNVAKAASYFNLGADDTDNPNVYLDRLSNGVKWRSTSNPYNVSGGTYVGMLLAGAALRYSSAK